jgi:hypothetical protein
MNDISMRSGQSFEAPERAAGNQLTQADARTSGKPPNPPAHGLLNWEGVVGIGLVADAALPVHPNDRLNTVIQIIVSHVVPDRRPTPDLTVSSES